MEKMIGKKSRGHVVVTLVDDEKPQPLPQPLEESKEEDYSFNSPL